ncbi:GNAT family N-acetyltransferase [Nocardioides sp. TRM66260-LWL]|uniref:GNAT family N-acetyltransferase n=1 Tax=Nocardioides sp. TRM66260-LWL TaxID=2874478 RepID=UPI001CC5CDAF|nr:GNAT family N-acetyltransferase [Nocardioides sp. TRM66260-LWL]MBZ5735949.1 GNAT family N-acetyltransferase [Nocardioides sp. TRM66260-LWL]
MSESALAPSWEERPLVRPHVDAGVAVAASGRWASPWFPPDSVPVLDGPVDAQLRGDLLTVLRHLGSADPATQLADATRVAASRGATALAWTTGPGASDDDVAALLAERGARIASTAEVMARTLPLADVGPGRTVAGLEIVEVATARHLADLELVNAEVWGHGLSDSVALACRLEAGTAGLFVAYLDGRAVGTAALALPSTPDDGVVRLGRAGVLAEHRGGGVYGALVRHRLGAAERAGARIAVAHARPTSAPILGRLGFAAFGVRTTWRLPIA